MSEWQGYWIGEPEEPTDYIGPQGIWTNNLVFGLPTGSQVSSDSCGAMPFRFDDVEGLTAKKCIRGEDWAWIMSWFYTRRGMPALGIFDRSQDIPWLISRYPRLTQLEGAMEYISGIWNCFGQSYDLSNVEVTMQDYEQILSSGLSNGVNMCERIPDELSGHWENSVSVQVPLYMEHVNNIFTDLSALQCTLGKAYYSSLQTVYSYSQENKDKNPVTTTNWLSGIYYFDGYYFHPTKKISMTIQPYAILRVSHSDFNDFKYMTYKVGMPRNCENSEDAIYTFKYPSMVGGGTIANGVADVLNINVAPEATGYSPTYCQIDIFEIYVAISADYMQLQLQPEQ